MILGIDLGTTYSVGAYLKDDGTVEIINNSDGGNVTPSVVMFDEEDGIIVGEVAKEHAAILPDKVVVSVKNKMGKNVILQDYQGSSYNPEMISSFIIKKLCQDAEAYTGEKVEGTVITVPAYFNDAQRKATTDAARLAGTKLAGMINEPTAAALCYIKDHDLTDSYVLVYDLGGGTFDASILHVDGPSRIEVVSTGGLSNTGGHFLDEMIADYVCGYMEEHHGIDLEDEEYEDEFQDLLLKAETAKIQLSKKKKTSIVIKVGKVKESIEITREWFESDKIMGRVYLRTEGKVKEVLKTAGLTPGQVDHVLLVGGSSRIPYVEEHIGQLIGKAPSRDINPSEAVAVGAALYSGFTQGKQKGSFTDVCSHSIGVVVLNEDYEEENEIIIHKNSQIPIEKEKYFVTAAANQKCLKMTVTEGEFKELSDVKIVGGFTITLPDHTPPRTQIIVRIGLNSSQLIHVNVSLPSMGFSRECELKRMANMDEEALANVTGMLRSVVVS